MSSDTRDKIVLLLGFLTTGTLVGFFIGRATSPDWSKPGTARWCLVRYTQWRRLDDQHGELTLRAGNRIYQYRSGDSAVTVRHLSAEQIAAHPAPKLDFNSDFEKMLTFGIAGPVEAGIVTKFVSMGSKFGKEISHSELAFLALGTAGTGVLGYYVGHNEKPDFENAAFEKELETDVNFWQQTERDFEEQYLWARQRYLQRQRTVIPQILAGSPVQPWALPSSTGASDSKEDGWRESFAKLHPEIERQVEFDPEVLRTVGSFYIQQSGRFDTFGQLAVSPLAKAGQLGYKNLGSPTGLTSKTVPILTPIHPPKSQSVPPVAHPQPPPTSP